MGTFSDKLMRLYDMYSWRGECCALCNVLRGKKESVFRDSQGNLCREHYGLYKTEIEAIKAGEAEFPPGFNENAKRVYLVDDDFWMQFRFLEAMIDKGELSEEEARKEMSVVVEILHDALTPDERRQRDIAREQERRKHMLPHSRLY